MARLLIVLSLLVSCSSEQKPVGPPQQIGGVMVSGETLRDGAKVYGFRCVTCHGPQGDGNGPTGRAQNPKPRDFRRGLIKFGSVRAGELATDADYARVITRGLRGTNMLAMPLPTDEVLAVTQYVRSLSVAWTAPDAKVGIPIIVGDDPWSDEAAALARGRALAQARCVSCHATPEHEGTASDSIYGWLAAPKLEAGMTLKAGSAPADIYRTLGAGIGGTGMKPLKDDVSEEDLWALVHYVASLATQR